MNGNYLGVVVEAYNNEVHLLSHQLDEKVSTLHFPALGAAPNVEPLVEDISACPSRRALQPTCRSRRAHEPIRAEPRDLQLFPLFLQGSNLRHSLWMRWAHHLCLQPFLGKAAGLIVSDFNSLLVSQGSHLLSCVILVEPSSCTCLFW